MCLQSVKACSAISLLAKLIMNTGVNQLLLSDACVNCLINIQSNSSTRSATSVTYSRS